MALTAPAPIPATVLIAWRKTRLNPLDHQPLTQTHAAIFFGVSLRTYQRYEADGAPGLIGQIVRADTVPPGYYRKRSAR